MKSYALFYIFAIATLWFLSCGDQFLSDEPVESNTRTGAPTDDEVLDKNNDATKIDADSSDTSTATDDTNDDAADLIADDTGLDATEDDADDDGTDDLADDSSDDPQDASDETPPRVVLAWADPQDPAIDSYNIFQRSSTASDASLWKQINKTTPDFDPAAPRLSIDPEQDIVLEQLSGQNVCFSIVAIRYGEQSDATDEICIDIP